MYQVEWEAHPRTGETYEPEWKSADDVGAGLLRLWEERKANGDTEQIITLTKRNYTTEDGEGDIPPKKTRRRKK
jgi:hypothetical protein